MRRYCNGLGYVQYPGITPIYAASREVVIYRLGVYYSTVVMLCKHVSQVLSNSSFNAVTGYDDGKKGWRGKHYQNPLPLNISSLLSFERSCVCTSLVEINYFKAVDVTRQTEISSLKGQHV
jgi:hypothetical protein